MLYGVYIYVYRNSMVWAGSGEKKFFDPFMFCISSLEYQIHTYIVGAIELLVV